MEIKLSLSDELAERAQALARQRDVDLAQRVVTLLEQAYAERPGDAFLAATERYPGRSPEGWRFDRDACHRPGAEPSAA